MKSEHLSSGHVFCVTVTWRIDVSTRSLESNDDTSTSVLVTADVKVGVVEIEEMVSRDALPS